MKILVTGATGFIGSALIDHLANKPHLSVVGMVRSIADIPVDTSVEFRLGEIGNPSKINVNLSDIDVIIHTAGRAHVMNDGHVNPLEEFRRVNTYGTLDLAKSAADAGVKRFVFLSSIKVNGESTPLGFPFTVDSEANPRDPYGISKHEAEIGLQEISRNTSLDITIIRPPLVYGPGVKGNFNTLINALSWYVPLPFASVKDNRRSMVGLDNLLSMLSVCVRHPKAANQIFLISDRADLSTCSLLRLLGMAIGKPAVLFKFPVLILELMAKGFGMEGRLQRIIGTLQVDISTTCSQLDWEPPFSVEDGLRKIGEEMS